MPVFKLAFHFGGNVPPHRHRGSSKHHSAPFIGSTDEAAEMGIHARRIGIQTRE
jgi:hypothetical protein